MTEDKLKILAVSDLHGDTDKVRKLAQQATDENVDLVFLCGDFVSHSSDYTDMIGPFLKAGKKVFLLAGNHESPDQVDFIANIYNVHALHGTSAIYNNVGIFGSGGVDMGINGIPDKEIFKNLRTGFEGIKHLDKKVMFTHVHPLGSKMDSLTPFLPPSPGVRMAIDQLKPDLLICGHVHEAAGLEEQIGETKVINVSKHGKIIEL